MYLNKEETLTLQCGYLLVLCDQLVEFYFICRAIMEKCGDEDDCISTIEANELAGKLDEDQKRTLPMPGQVDFINGGPPCQVHTFKIVCYT